MFTAGQVYSLIIFFMSAFILIDNGVSMVNAEIRFYMLKHNVIKRKVDKDAAKLKSHVIKEQVAAYKNTGFAYSGEAGNNTQVTEQLENRLQDALRKQLFSKGGFSKLQKSSSSRSDIGLTEGDDVPIMQKPNPLATLAAAL